MNTKFKDFDQPDIIISEIMIDGKASKNLPVSGYYDMTSECSKGSQVTWNSYSKTLQYEKGSFISDSCKLNFVSSDGQKLLKDVSVGSYVSYVGDNGCVGDSCAGKNINYVDVNDMGYCYDENYHFISSGFRVLYVKDNSVYLVSAGALDCVNHSDLVNNVLKYCHSDYVYSGKCDGNSVWPLRKEDIDQVDGSHYDLIDNGGYYWYLDGNDVRSWNPSNRNFSGISDQKYGVRVVIKMREDVLVSSGSGVFDDPYIIK